MSESGKSGLEARIEQIELKRDSAIEHRDEAWKAERDNFDRAEAAEAELRAVEEALIGLREKARPKAGDRYQLVGYDDLQAVLALLSEPVSGEGERCLWRRDFQPNTDYSDPRCLLKAGHEGAHRFQATHGKEAGE